MTTFIGEVIAIDLDETRTSINLLGVIHLKTASIAVPCTWHISNFAGKRMKYALFYQTKKSQVVRQYLKRFAHGGYLNCTRYPLI